MTFDTGLGDFHHMVVFATKVHVPNKKPKKVMYRSYKMFNSDKYEKDLSCAPFHVGEVLYIILMTRTGIKTEIVPTGSCTENKETML